MSRIPSLSPAPRKAVTIDEVYLFKNGTNNSLRLQGNNPTDNLEFKYKIICLLPLCAVSEFPWHVRRTRKAGQAQTHRQTQTRQTDTNTTDMCNQIRRTQTEVRQDNNGQAKTQTKRPSNNKDHNSQSSKTNRRNN